MRKIRLLLLLAATLTAFTTASSFRRNRGSNRCCITTTARANLTLTVRNAISSTKDRASDVAAVDRSDSALSRRGGDVDDGSNVDVPTAKELAGAAFFTVLQILLNKAFVAWGVAFPAMLGCTILVFATLVLSEVLIPGVGENAFQLLTPGSNLLTKWLPVMFVPGLAMLPLAPSIGSAADVVKVLSMIVLGFGFTMASTAYLVLAMRAAQGLVGDGLEQSTSTSNKGIAATAQAPPPPPKPFSDDTYKFLLQGTVLAGAMSMAATRHNMSYARPFRTIFMFLGTVLTYVFGARLPSGFTKIVHPLVISTVGTLLLTKLDSIVTGSSFEDILRTYKAGSLLPLEMGAGDLLLFLLGPAVGCLSVPMYSRKKIMADNLLVVIAVMICSSVGGLFGTAWYVRLLSIGSSAMVRLSLLSRNVTTGLAIVITQILEGNIAIAASVVVLTGIFGATVGRATLDALKVEDPVSRGLGMGAAGQGLGVAAMMPEKEAFPFAAINMVLTAVCATALVSIPTVKEMLVSIVSGGLKGGTE